MPGRLILLMLTAALAVAQSAQAGPRRNVILGGERLALEEVFYEDFSDGLEHWQAEGDAALRLNEGWLEVDARDGKIKAATLWCRQRFEGGQLVEYDFRLDGSSVQSNVNMFLLADCPGGLLETGAGRNGSYGQYHGFPNYLVTLLNETDSTDRTERLRLRLRLDPGFELKDERRFEPLVFGRVHHLAYLLQPPLVTVLLDGAPLIRTLYREKLESGFHGLRTWHTHLYYDNFRVSRVLE
ncbi:DUF6250 domain-containing protein [bacterium]|nr:DUF6250 domain-containing protein [bacterium]